MLSTIDTIDVIERVHDVSPSMSMLLGLLPIQQINDSQDDV